MSFSNRLNSVIYYCYLILFFVTPLLVSFKSYELFEFPKTLFVYLITILISTAWISNMIYQGKFYFKKSYLDPIFIFILATQTISTLLSLEPHTSIYGYYSRFHGGLLSTFCYIILSWGFITHATKNWVKNILLVSLSSACLISLYAIAEHFGIDANFWVQDVQNRVFSTLGQPNWLAALLVVLLPVTLYYFEHPPKSIIPNLTTGNLFIFTSSWYLTYLSTHEILPVSSQALLTFLTLLIIPNLILITKYRQLHQKLIPLTRYNFLLFFILFLLAILFTKSRSGIIALFVSLSIYFIFRLFQKNRKYIILPLIFSFLIILLIGTEWTPSFSQLIGKSNKKVKNPFVQTSKSQNLPPLAETVSESTDIRKVVWQGSLDIFAKYPLFGSGTETFAYSYYQSRPQAHNLLSEWDFLYNKAHNEYLNFLANNGFLGLTAIFTLVSAILISCLSQKFKTFFKLLIAFSVISILVYFLYPNLASQLIEKLLIYPPIAIPLSLSFLLGFILSLFILKPQTFQEDSYDIVFLASLTGIFITNFYGFSIVNIALLFFLIPAFLIVRKDQAVLVEKTLSKKTYQNSETNIPKALAVTLLSCSFLFFTLTTLNYFIADRYYNYAQSYLDQGNVIKAQDNINKAITLRSSEAYYYLQKALISSQAAYALSIQDPEDSTDNIKTFTASAEENVLKALLTNPVHLNIYKPAAKVYLTLAFVHEKYYQKAYEVLLMAQNLAPTDPQLCLNLALISEQLGNLEESRSFYEKAVSLKPNYRTAWIYLAKFYESYDEADKALDIYQFILDNIDPNDPTSLEKLSQ